MWNDDAKENRQVSRRQFLGGLAALGGALATWNGEALAQGKQRASGKDVGKSAGQTPGEKAAGGAHGEAVAPSYKDPYPRKSYIVPAGAESQARFRRTCTGCQLCLNACSHGALTLAGGAINLAQPVLSYERGYCHPGCHKCASVCPSGAIKRLPRGEKGSLKIGTAVYDMASCIKVTQGVECGQCARRCPAGAISQVPAVYEGKTINAICVNEEMCIGCGACEYYCPARPRSAIHVEGCAVHRLV